MEGYEELIKRRYLLPENFDQLSPDAFGERYSLLILGETTFRVLCKFLELDPEAADNFIPTVWKKPEDILSARPDQLVVKGRSIFCVCEHKSPGEIKGKRQRQQGLEQLHCYVLAARARLGVLTDGLSHMWLHNMDSSRKNDIKLISNGDGLLSFPLSPSNFETILGRLDPTTDTLIEPERLDPSRVARSVWQSVYVATRETPERCFQTFVELFTYKLLSDSGLLPTDLRIQELTKDPRYFTKGKGQSQIQYYLTRVRGHIKSHLFPPLGPPEGVTELLHTDGHYTLTRDLLSHSNADSFASSGATSVIDGHAFEKNPHSHNEAFVHVLRKLSELEDIRSLDRGFKSRLYEQFLRRDPNITKVSGKYLTPRNVVRAIVAMANVTSLPHGSRICDPACGVGGFITESMLALENAGIATFQESKEGKIEAKYKFTGLDCEYDVICLAKANFLLHTVEFFTSLSMRGRHNYQKLLADTFVWCHKDTQLGSLYHPAEGQFDLVMANPPYIVSGTGTVTKKIKDIPSLACCQHQ